MSQTQSDIGQVPPLASAATEARAPSVEPTRRVFVPVRRRVRLREIWTSLRVAWMIGLRDIKSKYKQTALGPIWLLVQPLAMLAAIVIGFSAVANVDTGDVPYVVFALVGLTPWTYIQMTLIAATAALPSNATVVRRSPCPRVALITGTLISTLPPFVFLLVASLIAAVPAGIPIQALLLPLMIIWLLMFTWGITLLVGAIVARFRDMTALAPLIMQAGIFLTPVGYPLNVSEKVSTLIALNPASGLIEAWRWSVLGIAPDLFAVAIAVSWTLGICVFGWYVFGRLETRFADYV